MSNRWIYSFQLKKKESDDWWQLVTAGLSSLSSLSSLISQTQTSLSSFCDYVDPESFISTAVCEGNTRCYGLVWNQGQERVRPGSNWPGLLPDRSFRSISVPLRRRTQTIFWIQKKKKRESTKINKGQTFVDLCWKQPTGFLTFSLESNWLFLWKRKFLCFPFRLLAFLHLLLLRLLSLLSLWAPLPSRSTGRAEMSPNSPACDLHQQTWIRSKWFTSVCTSWPDITFHQIFHQAFFNIFDTTEMSHWVKCDCCYSNISCS